MNSNATADRSPSQSIHLLILCLILIVYMAASRAALMSSPWMPRMILVMALVVAALGAAALLSFRRTLAERVDAWIRHPSPLPVLLLAPCVLVAARVAPTITLRACLTLGIWAAFARGYLSFGSRGTRAAWLAVLALAVLVRVALIAGLPRPLWYPDTPSYLAGVDEYLSGGPLTFNPHRMPGYSIYALVLLRLGGYPGYPLLSHALTLGIAWAAGRVVRRTDGETAGWLVFTALALSPHAVIYAHSLLSEALFIPLIAVYALLVRTQFADREIEKPLHRLLGAAGLGLVTAAAVLTRPGAILLIPVGAGAALLRRWRWPRLAVLIATASIPVLLWMAHQKQEHGVFRLTAAGSYALFGTTAHLIESDSPGHEELKAEMRDAIAAHNAAHSCWAPDYEWLLYQGPLKNPAFESLSPREQDRALFDVAVQALRRHPFRYIQRSLFPLWRFLIQPTNIQVLALHAYAPGENLFFEIAAHQMTRGYSLFPLELFEHWLLAIAAAAIALRTGRERGPLLTLAAAAFGFVILSCALNTAVTRYQLQWFPLLLVAFAVLAGDWSGHRCISDDARLE